MRYVVGSVRACHVYQPLHHRQLPTHSLRYIVLLVLKRLLYRSKPLRQENLRRYFLAVLLMAGSSFKQGGHELAQKFITEGFC